MWEEGLNDIADLLLSPPLYLISRKCKVFI